MKSFIKDHILPNLSKWTNHGRYHSIQFGYTNKDEKELLLKVINEFIEKRTKYFIGMEEGIIKVVKYE